LQKTGQKRVRDRAVVLMVERSGVRYVSADAVCPGCREKHDFCACALRTAVGRPGGKDRFALY